MNRKEAAKIVRKFREACHKEEYTRVAASGSFGSVAGGCKEQRKELERELIKKLINEQSEKEN